MATTRFSDEYKKMDRSPHASGPLYILTGIAGDARCPKWKQHPLDVYVIPDREASNYMTMTVTPNRLVVRAFLADGTQIDESVIEK